MDTIMGKNVPADMNEIRKLSITMCVNEPGEEYEGGEFQINNGQEKDAETIPTKKGRMIIFPSFMIHRVAPVTKGKRKSVVVWVTGPKFK
jgi:PKHD-type hydroxylase